MAKFYIDSILGSDTTGDGTLKFPYQTLQGCSTNNNFIENTTIILKTGVYPLSASFCSKIQTNVTLTIVGQGLNTRIYPSNTGNLYNVGYSTSTIVFKKLVFDNIDMPYQKVYNYNTCIWDTVWYFDSPMSLKFYNIHFNLTNASYNTDYGVISFKMVDLPARCLYFFQNSNNLYFENCTSASKDYMIINTNKTTLVNCYGNFSGKDTTNWDKTNSIITKTPLLDTKYCITNIDLDRTNIGVYHGIYSWYFTNFIILMNNTYYSIQDKYYNQDLKMYTPITKEDLQLNGFEEYAISSIGEFANRKVEIGVSTSKVSPIMTSNILPSPYIITASSQYDTVNYLPWKAFNGTNLSSTDCWITPNGSAAGWLQINFGSVKKVNSIKITSRFTTDTGAGPKDFTFQGSNDGINFITLLTKTGVSGWVANETREYKFTNEVEYQYYRLNITSNNGQSYSAIGELELFYTTIPTETYYPIDKFDNFKIVADTNNIIKIHGLKSTRELIVASGDITISMAKNISYFLLDANENKDAQNNKIGEVRIVYSTDKGVTWYTSADGINPVAADLIIPVMMYDLMADEEKVWCQAAKDKIAEIGMTLEMFNNFNFNVVDEYGIRFAYVLTRPSYEDIAEVKQLTWAFDKKGYMKELKDSEYDIDVYNHTVVLTSNLSNEIIQLSVLA